MDQCLLVKKKKKTPALCSTILPCEFFFQTSAEILKTTVAGQFFFSLDMILCYWVCLEMYLPCVPNLTGDLFGGSKMLVKICSLFESWPVLGFSPFNVKHSITSSINFWSPNSACSQSSCNSGILLLFQLCRSVFLETSQGLIYSIEIVFKVRYVYI